MKWNTKREINQLLSSDVIAIPLLTANMALVLEYWVINIGTILPFASSSTWSLVIFHFLMAATIYVNIHWDEIEEKAEEKVEEAE